MKKKRIIKKDQKIHVSIILDDHKIELIPADLDKDGIVGGTERITRKFGDSEDQGVIPVQNPSDLGDAMRELNKDTVEDSRLSGIDFRGRVHSSELPSMIALDSLIGMGFVPIRCGILNRVKMRKSVSIDGLGRKEHVEIVVGKRESDERKSMGGIFDKFKQGFGIGGNK